MGGRRLFLTSFMPPHIRAPHWAALSWGLRRTSRRSPKRISGSTLTLTTPHQGWYSLAQAQLSTNNLLILLASLSTSSLLAQEEGLRSQLTWSSTSLPDPTHASVMKR